MDFLRIKYFLALAEHLNYTKAANHLFISQSMLSRHIKSIEAEAGATLFNRNTREVTLTPAGKILADGLKNLDIEYNALLEQAKTAQIGYTGEIRIGVVIAFALWKFSELIVRYELEHPNLQIVMSTAESPGGLVSELMRNRIDFGIGMRMKTSYFPNLASLNLFTNKLCIVMSKRHRLASAPENSLSINDFENETFITPADETSTAYRELLDRCSSVGFVPKVITVDGIMSTALWVELNRGVTFLHEASSFRGNPNLVFNYLHDIDQKGRMTLYWNENNRDPRILAFIDYLRGCVE